MTYVRSAQSLEYVRVAVTVTDASGNPEDVTADPVGMAFVAPGAALDADTTFYSSTWEIVSGQQMVRCLVGPGGVFEPSAQDVFDVWVSITDNPEAVKLHSGSIVFR